MRCAYTGKITRPVPSCVVPRRRLFRLLDSGLKRPVLWVSGPAGSGKTTLISSYLDSRRLPCLWYQIDESDADIPAFFYHMGLAAKKAFPGRRKPMLLLTPEYLQGLATFTLRYFEELYRRAGTPFAVVFDNYQDVSAESPIHRIIALGLAAIPEGINVVVISREGSHPEFAKLRANRKMSLLGWNEMKFTLKETRDVLHAGGYRRVSSETAYELHRRTKGWVAGLVLYMERAREGGPAPKTVEKVTREGTFDYFATEVFEKADKGIQDFLLRTSFLPWITPEMAEKLTGVRQARRILSDLNEKHYFTARHAEREGVYEYHPLFKDFLLAKAGDLLANEEISRIQKNAAVLLEESGQVEDALEIFCAVHEWAEVVRIILQQAKILLAQGRSEVVRGWIACLPSSLIKDNGHLLYWRGICNMPFNSSGSRKDLERALKLFRAGNDISWTFLSWAGAVDVAMYSDEYGYLDSLLSLFNDFTDKVICFPSSEIESRVITGMFSALSIRQPYHPDIDKWEEKAFGMLQRNDLDINLRIHLGFYMLIYHYYMGNFSRARLIITILEVADTVKISDLMFILFNHCSALYDYFTGSIDSAPQKIETGLDRANKTGIHIWNTWLNCVKASIALSKQEVPTAKSILQKLSGKQDDARPLDKAYYNVLRAWEALLEGSADYAVEFARLSREQIVTVSGMTLSEPLANLMYAEALHENGDERRAAEHLSTALKDSRRFRSKFMEFSCLLTKANMMFDKQEHGEALVVLREAMGIGRRQKLMNVLFWRPTVMARLCAEALEAGIEAEHVRTLILKRNLTLEPSPVHIEDWPYPFEVRALGRFEILKDGKPVMFSGKVQQKPLQMLKALIAFGGKGVSEDQLSDVLWPEGEGDLAHRSFETTLYRLRKLIGNDRVIQLQEGQLSLDDRYCRVDVSVFESFFPRLEVLWFGVDNEELDELARLSRKAIGIYKGHFLPGDMRHPWTVALRERLRSKFLRLITKTGQFWEDRGQHEKALEYFEKGLEIDEHAEEFYQHIMKCYCLIGQQAKAVAAYKRCRSMLSEVFGINPSAKTEEIYKSLCSRNT